MTENDFGKLLVEAVDSALSSLGDSARQSVYFHLEKKFKIKKSNVPNRIDDFSHGLERIFGQGAQFLEILIMKKLYEEMGFQGDILKVEQKKEFRFTDYVKAAEQKYLEAKS